MKLRTNYSKNDWYRLLATLSLYAILGGTLILGAVNYFLIPAFQLSGMIAKFLNSADIKEKFTDYIKQYMKEKLHDDNDRIHYLVSTILVFFGVMFGTIMVFAWFITKSLQLPFWLSKKLHISPKMDLVVIKNDKFWFRWKL